MLIKYIFLENTSYFPQKKAKKWATSFCPHILDFCPKASNDYISTFSAILQLPLLSYLTSQMSSKSTQ